MKYACTFKVMLEVFKTGGGLFVFKKLVSLA